MKKDNIKVVLCEPGKCAKIADIDSSLEGLQAAVGGLIEAMYPFDESVCIIRNEEDKINGMELNRAIKDEGKVVDIIAGPFFVCGCNTESFSSLTAEQQKTYLQMFQYPEIFMRCGGEVLSIPYNPNHEI